MQAIADAGPKRVAVEATDGPARSLQQQLYVKLRADILEGRPRPGQKTASTRALAQDLGVSRTTVVLAYEQLLAEGFLESRRGSGTYVSTSLPEVARQAPLGETATPTGTAPLSIWARRLLPVLSVPSERYAEAAFDFRPGRPDWDAFPHRVWSRLAGRRWRQHSSDFASYGDPAGYQPLREAIAAHLARSRGVRCDSEQVVVVNGSQQGVDLLVRLWLDPGDRAAVENPGYPGAVLTLAANAVRVDPLDVDDDGARVASLPPVDSAQAPRLVYVTPSHQFPTGATLALARRFHLLDWAATRGAMVVEDDYDSEFRYSGRPLESLQGLDQAGVVAYVGSFSKALFPPLRVGYVVLPRPLVAPFVAAKWLADRQTATPDQQVLSDFIQEGHFERHLRRMRKLYHARRDALVDALGRELGGVVSPGGDGAGLHLVAWLPTGWDANEVAALAAGGGVATLPLSPYYHHGQARPGLMLGFAAMSEDRIVEGVRLLAQAVEEAHRVTRDSRR